MLPYVLALQLALVMGSAGVATALVRHSRH